jgi:hypothetical protein
MPGFTAREYTQDAEIAEINLMIERVNAVVRFLIFV